MPKNYLNRYKHQIELFIENALKEDIGSGDYSSLCCIDSKKESSANLLVKEKALLAGITLTQQIFKCYDSNLLVESYFEDGNEIQKGDVAFSVHGRTQSILATERLVLNTLQRMSGIASLTYELNQMIKHTSCKILDTRKTTPNFRYAEKWAVLIGGGSNHRMGLFDAIMIKDNHIDFCGDINISLEKTSSYLDRFDKTFDVIVECRNQREIDAALQFSCVSRILLDNYNSEELGKAINYINKRKETEASGRITRENLVSYAETGVDYLSMGELTYNAKSIDMSLKAV